MAFAAHVPTMLAMIIVCSLMMAICMAVVGTRQRRDGLSLWAAALLVNAIGHVLLLLRGQVPDALSIVLGNMLLSSVFVGMASALYQFQGRSVPWLQLMAPPVLVAILVSIFIDSFRMRVGTVSLLIGLQALWTLGVALAQRHATVGRGLWLLAAGMALEGTVLLGRALAAAGDKAASGGILQSNGLQTLTFLATFSVVLLSSLGFVFMLRDRADEENRRLAALDPLTGAANRRSLIAALARDVARAARSGEPIALMMVDIDHFKDVNDRYGHMAGDQVLRGVVDLLRERVRAQDLVGRYGGEEFMVLMPDTDRAGALQLARQLCQAVANWRCLAQGAEMGDAIAVTVSIGVFGGRLEPGDSWDMLIAAADRALYLAKENGRNRVEAAAGLRRAAPPLADPSPPETLPASLY